MISKLCDRHYGIGADGVLFVRKGQKADYEMVMYNPDGSRGEMCGNGIRCVGRYLWERGLTEGRHFTIESMGAVKKLEVMGDGNKEEIMLCVDMGVPKIGEEIILPVARESLCLFNVSMGNPHAVLFREEGEEMAVGTLGPCVEKASCFPHRTNVEFVRVMDRRHIAIRVWERGVGETLACGTGACAAAAVCMQKGLTDEEITVTLLGGELFVSKESDSGNLFLTGPAVTVFEGDLDEDVWN